MLDLARYNLVNEWPTLARLQAEAHDLEQVHQKAQGEVMAARSRIQAAQEQDAEAASQAVRSGENLPAPRHEKKARADLENAQRTAFAYERATAAARADVAAFVAENRDDLLEAMLEAVNENGKQLAFHARRAARHYAFHEDCKYDLKQFAPPPPAPDETAPAQALSTSIIGVRTQRSAGPDRGTIEQMLGFLASLGGTQGGPQDQQAGAA